MQATGHKYSANGRIFLYASRHMCTYEYPSVLACLLMRLQLKPRAGGRRRTKTHGIRADAWRNPLRGTVLTRGNGPQLPAKPHAVRARQARRRRPRTLFACRWTSITPFLGSAHALVFHGGYLRSTIKLCSRV